MSATTEIVTLLASEDGEVNPLLPHTSELIVGLIAFALLFWFLAKFVYPMFEKTYAERSEAIEGGIKRAEEAQAEAKAALEQYRAQLADARGEAGRIREDARAEGARIIEEMRAEAQEQAARIVERGEEQLAAERQRLVTEIRADIGRIAVDLAGRIVGESLADEARRTGTVERFLDDLDTTTTTGGRR
ncbi:F0F1 ATP synthase subunit B [Cryptosporangium sp. NPDC048952]|uniref:F0F1 ATP synthase subunit B n=1 Tax=Cryptosporangium sp. NPDC048952 TaxID=3363961 RepID=UPI00371A6B7F